MFTTSWEFNSRAIVADGSAEFRSSCPISRAVFLAPYDFSRYVHNWHAVEDGPAIYGNSSLHWVCSELICKSNNLRTSASCHLFTNCLRMHARTNERSIDIEKCWNWNLISSHLNKLWSTRTWVQEFLLGVGPRSLNRPHFHVAFEERNRVIGLVWYRSFHCFFSFH